MSEATLSSKTNVLSVWKRHSSVFCKFLSDEVETISGKARQSFQDQLNSKLVIGSFLEYTFEAILRSKTNVPSIFKGKFSVFLHFFSDEVGTIFWESKAKHRKLFKSKFGHRKLLRKWFWSYLKLKNECSGHLKKAFFSFLQIF